MGSTVRHAISGLAGALAVLSLVAACGTPDDEPPTSAAASEASGTATPLTEPTAEVREGGPLEFTGSVTRYVGTPLAAGGGTFIVDVDGTAAHHLYSTTELDKSAIELTPPAVDSVYQDLIYADGAYFAGYRSTAAQGIETTSGVHLVRLTPDGSLEWDVDAFDVTLMGIDAQNGVVAATGSAEGSSLDAVTVGFSEESGEVLWQSPGYLIANPTTHTAGAFLLQGPNGEQSGIDPASGAILWTQVRDDADLDSPLVGRFQLLAGRGTDPAQGGDVVLSFRDLVTGEVTGAGSLDNAGQQYGSATSAAFLGVMTEGTGEGLVAIGPGSTVDAPLWSMSGSDIGGALDSGHLLADGDTLYVLLSDLNQLAAVDVATGKQIAYADLQVDVALESIGRVGSGAVLIETEDGTTLLVQ